MPNRDRPDPRGSRSERATARGAPAGPPASAASAPAPADGARPRGVDRVQFDAHGRPISEWTLTTGACDRNAPTQRNKALADALLGASTGAQAGSAAAPGHVATPKALRGESPGRNPYSSGPARTPERLTFNPHDTGPTRKR